MKKDKLDDKELGTLLVCSVRYALGRRSYIVSDVCSIVKANRHRLAPLDRSVIIRDVREALVTSDAGDACDRRSWEELIESLVSPA